MRNWQMLVGGAAIGAMVLTGCASKLSQADRDLLNQALDASQRVDQDISAAQAAAESAEAAAARAESAATRAENAARSAQRSATEASDSAAKAARAFEMGQRK